MQCLGGDTNGCSGLVHINGITTPLVTYCDPGQAIPIMVGSCFGSPNLEFQNLASDSRYIFDSQ